jgi:hypothetical protein
MTVKKMVMIYRKSSPRSGKLFDERLISLDQLGFHLKRGWSQKVPETNDSTELESEYITPSSVTEKLKIKIKASKGTVREIAKKFNVSYTTAQKIRAGKL